VNDVPGLEIRVRFRGGQAAFQAAKGTPLVAAFLRAIRAEGGAPSFVVKTGTADLTIVGPAWPGVPMAVYGPGDASLDHTPDEHLNLDEYHRAIEVLARVLRDLYARPRAQANTGVFEE
jgi:LysW-gamma-L-lysine carboxypeptidase